MRMKSHFSALSGLFFLVSFCFPVILPAQEMLHLRSETEIKFFNVSARLILEVPAEGSVQAVTVVLQHHEGLTLKQPVLMAGNGLALTGIEADEAANVAVLTFEAEDPINRPDLERSWFLPLATCYFGYEGQMSCAEEMIRVQADWTSTGGTSYETRVMDAQGVDHAPELERASCTEANAHFIRGDCNRDGTIDISDAIFNLSYLFSDGYAFCWEAHDVNDDGGINLGDVIYSLNFQFVDGPEPPPPYADGLCGPDPTPGAPEHELGCVQGCPIPPEEAGTSPWPMFRHDPAHTGHTPYTGPATPTLAWTYQTGDGVVSSPSIGADGTIYVGSGWFFQGSEDHHLYALHPNGTLKWKHAGNEGFFSSPALGPDGVIYISSLDGHLYAIQDRVSHGHRLWTLYLDYFFSLSSPIIGPEGNIYVGSPSFSFYTVDPGGEKVRNYVTEWCIISSPAIAPDGTVIVGSKDHRLYAFSPDQTQPIWYFETGNFYDGHLVDSSPAIGADGTIYFGTDQYGAAGREPVPSVDNFWAVNPDGTLKWIFQTEDGVESSPAIGPDGTIYFGSYDSYLYALADEGDHARLKWKFKTEGAIDGSPTVDGDGVIYFGSRDANVYALYPDGSLKWTYKTGDGIESSPTIDDKGYLYIGSFDGKLYALGTGRPDVGIAAVTPPEIDTPGAAVTIHAGLRNFRGAEASVPVHVLVQKDGETVFENNVMAELSGGEEKTLSLEGWTLPAWDVGDAFVITISAQLADDENVDNNVKTVTWHPAED